MSDHDEHEFDPNAQAIIEMPLAWQETLYGLVEAVVQHGLIERDVYASKLDLLEHMAEHVGEVNEGTESVVWCDDFVFIRRDDPVGDSSIRTVEVAFCAATLSSSGGRAVGMYFDQHARPEESPLIQE